MIELLHSLGRTIYNNVKHSNCLKHSYRLLTFLGNMLGFQKYCRHFNFMTNSKIFHFVFGKQKVFYLIYLESFILIENKSSRL